MGLSERARMCGWCKKAMHQGFVLLYLEGYPKVVCPKCEIKVLWNYKNCKGEDNLVIVQQ